MVGDAAVELFRDTPVKQQLLRRGGGFARIHGADATRLLRNTAPRRPVEQAAVGVVDFEEVTVPEPATTEA